MNIFKLVIFIILGSSLSASAQSVSKNIFVSPFNFPLSLSSNFGELRGNHFHGGLDIKTGGTVGKSVCCIADGYVSRVLVMAGGYGKALFITHNNGYTSVYGHVMSFAPSVEKIVDEYQQKHETFCVDLRFEPNFIKFKKGEVIALSGNEGLSFGPHLHLEIRKTDTNEYVNPLQFYKDIITDTKAPIVQLIAIYPEKGYGEVEGGQNKKIIPLSVLSRPVTAWGKIGIGIKAFDYMNNTSNHYGVYQVKLFQDGKMIFNSQMNSFFADDNRRINGFTDYPELKSHGRWIMRSYSLPGNPLMFVNTSADRGIVDINQERDYKFRYELSDIYGNKKEVNFTITGKKETIEPFIPKNRVLYWNKTNILQEPGFELVLPKGILYEDVELNYCVRQDSSSVSNIYQINDSPIPLHTYCSLMIGIKNKPVMDTSKYYVAMLNGKSKRYVGGTYEKGWMKADIRELGTYTVAIDTIAPKLIPLSKNMWKSGNIQFRISDAQTGIKSYKVYIDNKFYIFSYSLKNNKLVMKHPSMLPKGTPHVIDVTIEDNCGNICHEKFNI